MMMTTPTNKDHATFDDVDNDNDDDCNCNCNWDHDDDELSKL